MEVLGVDLAWAEGSQAKAANETGVAAVGESGHVLDAGWTVGLDETVAWIAGRPGPDVLAMVDAPLVVDNDGGQRTCERQVGQRYGQWKVSANSTNRASPSRAGVVLRQRLERHGWAYQSGGDGPPTSGLVMSECYPYTTLVGAPELGFAVERPRYKRRPKTMSAAEFQPKRATVCDEIIARLDALAGADPPLHLRSHPETAALVTEPSPLANNAYKHREDLLDAVLCAWTGLLWLRFGLSRCQVLGEGVEGKAAVASIIAPARPEQRRPTGPPNHDHPRIA